MPPPTNLRGDVAAGDMASWSFLSTLPSQDDMDFMKYMFTVLVGRVLVKRITWMEDYKLKDCVTWEVEHKYSEEMRQKSEEVCTGHARTCDIMFLSVCSTP